MPRKVKMYALLCVTAWSRCLSWRPLAAALSGEALAAGAAVLQQSGYRRLDDGCCRG